MHQQEAMEPHPTPPPKKKKHLNMTSFRKDRNEKWLAFLHLESGSSSTIKHCLPQKDDSTKECSRFRLFQKCDIKLSHVFGKHCQVILMASDREGMKRAAQDNVWFIILLFVLLAEKLNRKGLDGI